MTAGADHRVVAAAVRRPQQRTPPRPPGSVRRASHVGVRAPDADRGAPMAQLHVHAAVRDIVTDARGAGRISADANLDCVLTSDRTLVSIAADPAPPRLGTLVGRTAHRGWRAAARDVVGHQSSLTTLLDDVPIAVMLSSYGALRQGQLAALAVRPLMLHMADLCSGWASDATPMRMLHQGGVMALPGVVPVPAETTPDELAAEPSPPMAPGEIRRSRRLDVVPGEPTRVEASFRDSWRDPDAGEGILHEYVLTATIDEGVIASVEAAPRVLPYDECSFAAASPQRLVGHRIEEVPELVASAAGPGSCTHLNDLLRTLAAVPTLLHAATAGDAASSDW